MLLRKNQDSVVQAKRTARIQALRSEFDAFLYAPIGQSDDEVSLSVLSALARQNIDAWEEAATLTHLSRDSAIARLASIISPMTKEPPDPAQAETAARLVALLPQSDIFNLLPYVKSSAEPPRNITPIVIYIVIGALIIASALLGN
jgi:hypothetical protein